MGNSEARAGATTSMGHHTTRYRGTEREETDDQLAIEEPLQIRLAGEDVAVTMRTPGHDEELALGFLFTEGIITSKDQIESISYCPAEDGSNEANIINVLPTDRELLMPGRWGRNFISSSSCGLCGKTSIEQVLGRRQTTDDRRRTAETHSSVVRRLSSVVFEEAWPVSTQTLYALPDKLRAGQDAFAHTGGIHAAALFTPHGDLLVIREDVGRHNAVDKVIGYALLNGWLALDRHILLVSSRASFEIVQKALAAGVSLLAVISAPSSLAVELASEADMTLVAFLRGERLNVYAGEWRVTS